MVKYLEGNEVREEQNDDARLKRKASAAISDPYCKIGQLMVPHVNNQWR
jgi:hypothetical protein